MRYALLAVMLLKWKCHARINLKNKQTVLILFVASYNIMYGKSIKFDHREGSIGGAGGGGGGGAVPPQLNSLPNKLSKAVIVAMSEKRLSAYTCTHTQTLLWSPPWIIRSV